MNKIKNLSISKFNPIRNVIWILILTSLVSCIGPAQVRSVNNPPVSKEIQKRKDIVKFGRQFIGTKYKYAGKTPRTGFDCSGYTSYVFNDFDMALSASSALQSKQGTKVKLEAVQPGDLVFFWRKRGGRIFHVALVSKVDKDNIFVLHSTSRGVVEDNITNSSYWAPKIAFFRRVID